MKPTIPMETYKCRPVRIIDKGWGLFLFCLLFIFVGVMAWVLFAPSPRLERAKIAMHDEATFAKLQAKHGKKATEVVIYEEDGQAYYYRGKEKIKFQ